MDSLDTIDAAFKNCTHRLVGHYPISPKETLKQLSESINHNEEADRYGSGKLIENFEKEMATVLGKESAVFLPSGTMAQVIALRIHSDEKKNPLIGFHSTSHLELHEHHAYKELHGLQSVLVGASERLFTLDDLNSIKKPISGLLVELPQREIGGLLPEWSELEKISQWAKVTNTRLHLDGARLWECQPYYQREYSEICTHFDSVYVSFYKSLGGIAGAVLAGTDAFVREAKVWQRRQGGNLVSLYPFVASARNAYSSRIKKMNSYFEKAQEVASIISSFPRLQLCPLVPQTNLFHVYFHGKSEILENAAYEIALEERVTLFRKLQESKLLSGGLLEITIGDAALDLPNDRIYFLFDKFFKKISKYD